MDRESNIATAAATQVADGSFGTRRRHDRVFCAEQNVQLSIRLRGEMRSHRAELLDISGFGAAVAVTRPLTSERTAFVSMSWGNHRIRNVVCTISNCLQTSKTNALLTGYRCGLSFRPSSPLQLDCKETVESLDRLADDLAAAMSELIGSELATQKEDGSDADGFGLVGFDLNGTDQRAGSEPTELKSSNSTPLPPDQPAA